MAPDGGLHPTTNPVDRPTRHGADLDRIVAGLRAGDLAFVVAAVRLLGPVVASHPDAPAEAERRTRFVHDVAFALADLAVADDTDAAGDPDALLARAIDRACHRASA